MRGALLALTCLLPLGSASAQDRLAGSWRAVEADGPPRQGTLELTAGPSPGTWRAAATYQDALGQRTEWRGMARRSGEVLNVDLWSSAGMVGVLTGGGGPLGRGRFRIAGDALLGGWTLGPHSGREVWVREGTCCDDVRPNHGPEPAEGTFGAGRDAWPQLNANHPEVLTEASDTRGLVVTTLSPAGRADAAAHLDHTFAQPFRVFVSNQNRTSGALWQVIALVADSQATVELRVAALASASTREAPYRDLGPLTSAEIVEAAPLTVARASGPGEAAASRALRGEIDGPQRLSLPPGQVTLLSVRRLAPREERMTHADLIPDGPVRAAVLYLPGPRPSAQRVALALRHGRRVARSAHDHVPSPPGATSGALIFGRVSGVVAASEWSGRLTNDRAGELFLTLPGESRAFLWNAKHGALGQAQAAPLLARLPDSAYRSWGNYGAAFALEAVLRNPTDAAQRVELLLDSPGSGSARALRQGFALELEGPAGVERRSVRVSQRMGVQGREPLLRVDVPAGSVRVLRLRAVYSANNTAPNPLRLRVTPAP
jgi:hypothetical protein